MKIYSKNVSAISYFIKMLIIWVMCLFLFCERDFTPFKINIELIPQISLEVEKIKVKEVWLELKIINPIKEVEFVVYRDTITIFKGKIKGIDTVLYDYNLIPDHSYSYKASLFINDTLIDSSNVLSVRTKEYDWQFIGLQDTLALHLKIYEPYLYVCAGVYGLFRTDIYNPENNWKYLGLSDSNLGTYINLGVQDVLEYSQNPSKLLVIYRSGSGSDHGIYRSLDDGISWAPADSGMEVHNGGNTYYYHVNRFLQYPDKIISAGGGVWYTNNFGDFWHYYTIDFGIWVNALVKYPISPNILLLGGEGVGFDPWLFHSNDYGQNWTLINLLQVVPLDNAVYSIAFDNQDPNIFYIGMQGAIIKTTDGGQSWISPLVTNSSGYFFRAILADPNNANHLWAVAGTDFIETWDKGVTWQTINSPIPSITGVFDMVWFQNTETIYIATLNGVYFLKP